MKRKKSIIITVAIIFHVSLIIFAGLNVTQASGEAEPLVSAKLVSSAE